MNVQDEYTCLTPRAGEHRSKILLVYPKIGSEARNVSLYPPLSLLYLAAVLKDYPVAIYDQRVDPEEKFDRLLAEKPLCVGFSIITGVQINYALELAQKVKDRGVPTVFGGIHATILPEQTQQDERVDYVVAGEGELAFRSLIETLEAGRTASPVLTSEKIDLDAIPILPYELVDVENYVLSAAMEGRSLPFLFSRGCPFECTFCCNPVITKRKWRTVDIDLALSHMNHFVEKYQLDGIIFWDENLSVNPRILNELAGKINGRFKWFAQARTNALLNYDLNFLEKMGARRFSCGIESGSPAMLEKIKKEETVEEYIASNRKLAQTGISVWYNYITGYPEETLDDLKDTIRLAVQILDDNPNANNNTFYLLTPYPGTEIAERHLKAQMPSRLQDWASFGRHNLTASWHSPEMLKLFSRIYFSSKFVGRRIWRLFPNDTGLTELMKVMTKKWRDFDFSDDREWDRLTEAGWKVLRHLFGEHAY